MLRKRIPMPRKRIHLGNISDREWKCADQPGHDALVDPEFGVRFTIEQGCMRISNTDTPLKLGPFPDPPFMRDLPGLYFDTRKEPKPAEGNYPAAYLIIDLPEPTSFLEVVGIHEPVETTSHTAYHHVAEAYRRPRRDSLADTYSMPFPEAVPQYYPTDVRDFCYAYLGPDPIAEVVIRVFSRPNCLTDLFLSPPEPE
jgi:hypothetical protein